MVLSEKETRLFALAFLTTDDTPKINYEALSTATGMTLGSTKFSIGVAKKHARELKEKEETLVEYSIKKGPTKDTPKKGDVKSEKDQTPKSKKAGAKGDDNNSGRKEASTSTAKSNGKGKAAATKATVIKKELHGSETEAGAEADEEDNVGSGTVTTDATPLTTQGSNVIAEADGDDPYADMYGDGEEGGESPTPVAPAAKVSGMKSKKRARGNSQKKNTSSPTPPSEGNSQEQPKSSKKAKLTPKSTSKASITKKTSTPTTPANKDSKNGNDPTPSAGSQAYDDFIQGSGKKPAPSTDGTNDVDDTIVVVRNNKIKTPSSTPGKKKISQSTPNAENIGDLSSSFTPVNGSAENSNTNTPASSTPPPAPPNSPQGSFMTTDTPAPPTPASKKMDKKATPSSSVATSAIKLTPSRPIGLRNAKSLATAQATPGANGATPTRATKEIEVLLPRPRTPTPASGSKRETGRGRRGRKGETNANLNETVSVDGNGDDGGADEDSAEDTIRVEKKGK